MNAIIQSLKNFWCQQQTVIDNFVFRLHYRWTVAFLLIASIVLTGREYLGNPIECLRGSSYEWSQEMINNYCFTSGTFSVTTAWRRTVGEEIPYPGVDQSLDRNSIIFHSYYQWVNFVFFLQAGFLYFPRLMWKGFEGGRMCQLVLNDVTMADDARWSRVKAIVRYLERYRGKHLPYFWGFALAESCNLFNVVAQMLFLDAFLGGKFLSYGVDVLNFDDWNSNTTLGVAFSPMSERFPLLTKCLFFDFGHSGTLTKRDVICHLGLNALNEKMFLFFWFWYCLLLTLSSSMVLYRLLAAFFPPLRFVALRASAPLAPPISVRTFVQRSNVGDWFIVNILAQNMDALNFCDLLNEYVKRTCDQNGNLEEMISHDR